MTDSARSLDGHGVTLTFYPSPRARRASTLLVLLPGVNIRAEDFAAHGFVAMLQAGEDAVDLLLAEPDLDHYLDGTIARRLNAAIAERRSGHHRRLWLGGISLGGFGALLAAEAAPGTVDGIVLLSPFLGTPGLIAEVERAGGLTTWQPGAIVAGDGERRLLAWLQSLLGAGAQRPVLRLGYGRADRFAAAAMLLAAGLPPRQVQVVDGGHDWPSWIAQWRSILDAQPFSSE